MRTITTSCVVIGSGIAGLSTALGHGDAVVVSKTALGEGSSRWAQGGIAAAVGNDDSPDLHADDTVRVSAGLGRETIAALVAEGAGERIEWLRSLGASFDVDDAGEFSLGKEAGHSRHRIIHANGDATGAEVMRTLTAAVAQRPDITCLDQTFALDLLVDDMGQAAGVLALDADGNHVAIIARAVVLATGGIGRVYQHTTNPVEVTGDGFAMAIRAGVEVRDPEFVQFHPTALHSDLDPMPLLTEALRGEGAHLVDAAGHRFMVDAHDDAELAPRDIVARHIHWQRQSGPVFLDARNIGPEFPTRFPTVWAISQSVGLDPRVDVLPVSPAEHYHMGGIATDERGRTSMPRLYAVGEAASTGLHGANRLASNSLLEGLVFGARVAVTAATETDSSPQIDEIRVAASAFDVDADRARERDVDDAVDALRTTMWDHVGLVRDEAGLEYAVRHIQALADPLRFHREGRNLATVGLTVATSALDRRESRGSHHRSDHTAVSSAPRHTRLRPEPVAMCVLSDLHVGQNACVEAGA